MQLLSNSDSAHWTFPRCCWRFDRAKLGDRPPRGCLTASLSPTAPASSRRKPIAWERSRRSPTRPDRRSTAVFKIVEDRSLADRIEKLAERVSKLVYIALIRARSLMFKKHLRHRRELCAGPLARSLQFACNLRGNMGRSMDENVRRKVGLGLETATANA